MHDWRWANIRACTWVRIDIWGLVTMGSTGISFSRVVAGFVMRSAAGRWGFGHGMVVLRGSMADIFGSGLRRYMNTSFNADSFLSDVLPSVFLPIGMCMIQAQSHLGH